MTTGVGGKLITTGLYALVRHPWIHCFTLLLLSLVLVSRSSLLLIASPIWILLDIVLVVVQDKFFFDRMFDGYTHYRKETPMLVPNRRSINTFINCLKRARA
jgi:protein-S-isoprenylcysteine O-methyltransferase Ste14